MSTEAGEGRTFARFLEMHQLPFVFVSNTTRSAKNAANLRSQGFQKGFPDYLVLRQPARRLAPGLAWEMKRPGGPGPRPEQLAWLDRLDAEGWIVGWGDAAKAIAKVKKAYDL